MTEMYQTEQMQQMLDSEKQETTLKFLTGSYDSLTGQIQVGQFSLLLR